MTIWPRTLLWRSVLLIALLLIVAHLAWLQIFRVSEREPRAMQVAQQIVSAVNLTRAALITAQPDKRLGLLRDLSHNEGIRVYLAQPGETVPPLPDRPFLQLVEKELQQRLGPQTRMAVSRDGIRGAWVNFSIDEDEYWVMLPRARIERNDPLRWLGWGALALLLALIGAFLIVARINRPLRELTRAAAQMGQGKTPQPVVETGPTEIQTLARAFNQMAADLKQLDDERALLLAGVSHDLRTPLSRIRLGLEMLDAAGDPALKAGMVQDIEDIDVSIGQFLDFARIAEAEQAIPGSDLNALLNSAGDRYARLGKSVSLKLAPLPPVVLRPVAMQRLINNLIENALRHGGPDVEVCSGVKQDRVFLEVLDRGPGIPEDKAEHMLRPFTRLDSARGGPGTGLGLAIVDRIARMHGGSVSLLPREGGGLRARIELPANQAAPQAAESAPYEAARSA
jgi:two-component system osmolarity sensor histidine kinase EnvZ